MLDTLDQFLGDTASLLWGNPITLILLLGTGLYLTIRLGLVQVVAFRQGWRALRGTDGRAGGAGQISPFQALSTALSGTIGTGNIAGVATAIALGGPGALFWMWVTAFFGMATKFAETTLAVRYREVGPDGTIAGGPMFTLLHGLNMKKMAILFAAFTLIASFGIGNMVQANSVVDGLTFMVPNLRADDDIMGWMALIIGLTMAVLVALVIIGGVKRIAMIASAIVPFMAVVYMIGAFIVIVANIEAVPAAVATILNLALNPWAAGGGAIGLAIQYGVARGMFSNEAGLGSSAMAHAAAKNGDPPREGSVAMLEPFIDTIVVCTLTGLAIVVTGAYIDRADDVVGASLTATAFSSALGPFGAMVVGFSLMLFAFSTMIAWSYYGDRSAYFLFGDRAVMPYRIAFVILIVIGATIPLGMVWNFSDIANILMAAPNLIALILLAGLVKKLRDDYVAGRPMPDRHDG
ncbi:MULTISPECIES: sodium:alanine symporter family protein [unclassified Thioalkalivibrio]|uniref:alanine/glycine:cation symporter family protein n=1 Tax=unclassified Thioalkalivibrio TaxID=2621013 RepID=UPI00037447AB|nr:MULTISPECIES: alanine/glycine:cation symporter family protein [unclassified Thioalkalivibrio]